MSVLTSRCPRPLFLFGEACGRQLKLLPSILGHVQLMSLRNLIVGGSRPIQPAMNDHGSDISVFQRT
jgi:hypothetical protein